VYRGNIQEYERNTSMADKDNGQKAAVISMDGTDQYLILLPDYTVTKADAAKLKFFLTSFREIDQNPEMRNGDQGTWKQDDPALAPARIYAYITTCDELVLLDFTPFERLFECVKTEYVSIREYAQKHGKSIEQIKVLCQQGRLRGATKINNRAWAIPEDASYPEDSRMTANGKYIGVRSKVHSSRR
jgi:hypothetical protein